eukprot:3220682-Amphidinium_carterae.1
MSATATSQDRQERGGGSHRHAHPRQPRDKETPRALEPQKGHAEMNSPSLHPQYFATSLVPTISLRSTKLLNGALHVYKSNAHLAHEPVVLFSEPLLHTMMV